MNVAVWLGPDSDERSGLLLATGAGLGRRLVDAAGTGRVVAVAWGGAAAALRARTALALGADGAVVGAPEAAGTIAPGVRPDLVIAVGVPLAGELAGRLGLPCLGDVVDLALGGGALRARSGRGAGLAEVALTLPALVVLAPAAAAVVAAPRRPTFADLLAARAKPLERSAAAPPEPVVRPAPERRPAAAAAAVVAGDDGGAEGAAAIVQLLERSGVLAPPPPFRRGEPTPGYAFCTPERAGPPELEHAGVVVAGGRGLGDAAGFAMVEELARLIGAAPAASGGAVAGGWAPRSLLVGQTGRRVRPSLYLAFGISGASQHLAGLKGAPQVVAVNEDPASPIFAVSDIAVVAEPRAVLARLIDLLKP